MKRQFLYLIEFIFFVIGFSLMFLINIWPRSFFIESISDCSFYFRIKHFSFDYTRSWQEAHDLALISTLVAATAFLILFFFQRHNYLSGIQFAREQILRFISILKEKFTQ